VALRDRAARFPATAAAIAGSGATLFTGTSYLWGGVTPWGADCSGFVQAVFALHGVPLPRDAWQQALEGDAVSEDASELRPADLLFFTDREDRRITHVGLALGDARMAHVALGRGGFAVEQLGDAADPYVARLVGQRCAARRIV
jgi:cell wall-associated NlpC family hydrolase